MERDLEALLPPPAAAYDACDKQAGRVSSLSLVRYKTNDYSVPVAHGYRDIIVRGYVDLVVISCRSEIIARHLRSYQRDDFVYDPIHYLPLLEQKTGALDQAAPQQGWNLPQEFGTLRLLLESKMGRRGKREFVQVLKLLGKLPAGRGAVSGERCHPLGRPELRCGEATGAVPAGVTATTAGPGAVPLPAPRQRHLRPGLHEPALR